MADRTGKNRKRRIVGFRAAALLLAICLLAGCGGPKRKTVYQDWASAGACCERQYEEHSESVAVTVHNTDDLLHGVESVWKKVQKESVVHTGDPMAGDHLAVGIVDYALRADLDHKREASYDITITVKPVYATTPQQEKELEIATEEILRSLSLDGCSEYEKALAIYQYICDHVSYDYEHLEDETYYLKYSAYAASQGTAVCSGIADLFYCLANSAGLDARIVTNANHAWNFVRIDGRYYYLDATWDLGKSREEYDYFLKGSEDFVEHPEGSVSFGPNSFCGLLTGSDRGYDFSRLSYGCP